MLRSCCCLIKAVLCHERLWSSMVRCPEAKRSQASRVFRKTRRTGRVLLCWVNLSGWSVEDFKTSKICKSSGPVLQQRILFIEDDDFLHKNVKIYQTRHKNLAWSTAHTLSWDFSCSKGYEGPTGFGRPNLASRIPDWQQTAPCQVPDQGVGPKLQNCHQSLRLSQAF